MSLYARPVESDPEMNPTSVGDSPGPRRSDPFRVLRTHRNFRLFWTGQTASLVGTWMQTMAVGWLSLELSNSAFVVGLVASMGALPIVLFSMHAGALVDRGNKLRIVRITQTLFLLQALVLFGVTLSGHVTVGLLLGLSLVQGALSAVEIPARQSLIIQLVGREDLQPAIALNSSGFNLARVVGPAVGGAVIGKLGIAWCFGLNALSFGWVLWGLARIGTANSETANGDGRASAAEHAGFRREGSRSLPFRNALSANGYRSFQTILRQTSTDAWDGLRYLALPGPVRELLLLVTIGAILGGPFIALMPVVARDQLGLGAEGYGALLAGEAIAACALVLAVASGAAWRRGMFWRVV